MIRIAFLAASTLLLATPATAQSISQSDLEARYDRALAAGYKAMFLCSAIANAERNGTTRTPESVIEWELTGIQSPLNEIVGALPFRIFRDEQAQIYAVATYWSDDHSPRIALREHDAGCAIQSIGYEPMFLAVEEASSLERSVELDSGSRDLASQHRVSLDSPFFGATEGRYGSDARTTALIVYEGRSGREWFNYPESLDVNASTPQRTWSVAKSIAATLVGAAVNRGEADVDSSAGLGESRSDPRRAITIDHGLRMATGRYSDTPGNRTDALYFGGATVDEVAVDWPLVHAPGTVFRYANNDTLIAQQAIEHTFEEHPPSALFEAIGMTGTVAETDWQGNYILSSQVWATAPDLLRLGQLYLDDGVLPDGTRILPEGWVEYVSTPSGPQPDGARGWGYGAGWWLLNNSEGIPADTILAAGNRGQYIVVIPSRDIVIVRRGEDPAGGSGFDIEAFTRDVLAALED